MMLLTVTLTRLTGEVRAGQMPESPVMFLTCLPCLTDKNSIPDARRHEGVVTTLTGALITYQIWEDNGQRKNSQHRLTPSVVCKDRTVAAQVSSLSGL